MANCGMCGIDVTFDMMQYSVPDFEGKKHRICKNCSVRAQGKALKYDPATGGIVIVEKAEIEIRKKCNVCGNVFCYNPVDLDNNKKKQSQAMWSAIGSIGGAMSGHYAASAVQQSNTNQALSGIVDYNKCPKCGSMDLREISKEEIATQLNNNGAQQASAPQISVADELKKFKELLDLGVITEAEFEEKKKELLSGKAPAAPTTLPAPESQPTQFANQTQDVPNYADTNKKPNSMPTKLFRIIAILGVIFGVMEVYAATNGFRSTYFGVLGFVVGNEAYISALLAVVIWSIWAVLWGFIVGRITASFQKNR